MLKPVLGDTFVRKAKEAILERQEHIESFLEFDAALPAADTTVWTKMCQAWEADLKQLNPFEIRQKGELGDTILYSDTHYYDILVISDSEVRLRLAREDAERLLMGKTLMLHKEVTPSLLIWQGLEIEDLQYVSYLSDAYFTDSFFTDIGFKRMSPA